MHDIDPRQVIAELLNSVRWTRTCRRGRPQGAATAPLADGGGQARGRRQARHDRVEGRPVIRRLQFLIVAVVLLVAAFSTGLGSSSTSSTSAACGRWQLRSDPIRPGGPRGGIPSRSPARARRRRHADDIQHLQRERAAQTVARGVQPDRSARTSSGPGSEPSLLGPALVIAIVPLTRRGTFRIEPMVVRTGDPFGFFEAAPRLAAQRS